MTHKTIITIITAFLLLTTVSGCLDSARNESARLRWERTIDQARLQAAQQSLDEGRLMYAERILQQCQQCADPESPLALQVEIIQAQLQDAYNRFAKADAELTNPDEMTY